MRMKLPLRVASLAVLLSVLAFGGVGCKQKGPPPAAAGTSSSTLPGASDVIAAATAKDYDKAMASWVSIRQTVTEGEQANQFNILTHELKLLLIDAEAKDKKAAEALATIRGLSSGR